MYPSNRHSWDVRFRTHVPRVEPITQESRDVYERGFAVVAEFFDELISGWFVVKPCIRRVPRIRGPIRGRPPVHAKTHKVPEFANPQEGVAERGGILCQTLGEAEVMAASGVNDIHFVRMVDDDPKPVWLVRLSEKLDHFSTTVDGPGNIDPLQRVAAERGATVGVLLEIDDGLYMCSVKLHKV